MCSTDAMLRLSTFCMLLAVGATQSGYDYNRPNRPFGQGSSSSRPGTSPDTTTPYPVRPQSDDFGGPTTGYPTGPQNYPSSSQRPGYSESSYPGQGSSGPSGPGGYPGPDGYPRGPGGSPSGPGYPGGYPGGYSGQSDSNYHAGGSSGYPGQSDSSYPQGTRESSGSDYPGSKYPGQDQYHPGQHGSNFGNGLSDDSGHYERGDYSAIPGEPDIDYPILSYVPQTNFNCKAQQYPGYYADVETRCQVFHVCANNRTYDFLCPNGTVFSQEDFVCVWWNQFSCNDAPSLYELNAKLYDYSNRGSSDFPVSRYNDYSEPNYSDRRAPQGQSYPDSGNPRPGGNYPGNNGPQGPTTPFSSVTRTSSYPSRSPLSNPGQGSSGNYPGSQGPSGSYPGSQGPSGGYPGPQGASGNYPSYQNPGSYPSGPPPGRPGGSDSGYPESSTPYPDTGSGNQGYPSGRPTRPSFSGPNSGRQSQKPNREYLPPRNKRTKGSKHRKH